MDKFEQSWGRCQSKTLEAGAPSYERYTDGILWMR